MNANHLPVPPWEKELEADRFAGYVIKKLETAQYGTSLAEAIEEEAQYRRAEGKRSTGDLRRSQEILKSFINAECSVGEMGEGSGDVVRVPADAFVLDRVLEAVLVLIEAR